MCNIPVFWLHNLSNEWSCQNFYEGEAAYYTYLNYDASINGINRINQLIPYAVEEYFLPYENYMNHAIEIVDTSYSMYYTGYPLSEERFTSSKYDMPVFYKYNHQPTSNDFGKNTHSHKHNLNVKPSDNKHYCEKCGKGFNRRFNLKSHMKTHVDSRPFTCLHFNCNKSFKRTHDLKRHELLHTGKKEFCCECGNTFSRKDSLKRHKTFGGKCPNSTTIIPA
ncbi:hypothetical protein BDB01DRAFT_736711 [Pilobolus umbonatus]|nr:hypothetical protein BDB01DRAFT_736711 [Pilobolus umbonatus]